MRGARIVKGETVMPTTTSISSIVADPQVRSLTGRIILWLWKNRKRHLSFVPRWHITFDDVLPFCRAILLTEAARRARNATVNRLWGHASETMTSNPLDYFATALAGPHAFEDGLGRPLHLYGRRFASTRRVLVPMKEREALHIDDNGATLRELGSKKIIYTDLELLRGEMRKRIRYIARAELTGS
jgi:hypothetical protein